MDSNMKKNEYTVFPWWKGYILKNISRLRKKYQNPEIILKNYVKEGMMVADIGCGMGYFSLPMAEMVGDNGIVVAVDLQRQMLKEVQKMAKKQNKEELFCFINCSEDSLKLDEINGQLDFVLVFAVAHEVLDRRRMFKELVEAMKKGGKMLFAEPQGHVSEECFNESIDFANEWGLKVIDRPKINMSRAVVLEK